MEQVVSNTNNINSMHCAPTNEGKAQKQLPDVIDKKLFYSWSWIRQQKKAQLSWLAQCKAVLLRVKTYKLIKIDQLHRMFKQ